MKAKIILLMPIVLSFFLGVFSASFYFASKIENINEDIISNEVKIISLANTINTPCEKLSKSNEWLLERHDDFTIFWMMYSGKAMIAKLVVDNNFSSAVETFKNNCSEK